jgi:hypothetical protein
VRPQQIIQDERLSVADYDRVFPHDPKFPPTGCSAESRGLLWNESFIEGLSPTAFFIHAIAGREALVVGATSTAQSGYSMRLIGMVLWTSTDPAPGVKMMECDCTDYSYAVRDGAHHIVQFQYTQRVACTPLPATRCAQRDRAGPEMAGDGIAPRGLRGRARCHRNVVCRSLKKQDIYNNKRKPGTRMNALPFSIGTFFTDSPMDAFIMGPFNPLAAILGHSMIIHEHNHIQSRSVGPVITTEFPDTAATQRKRKRVTSSPNPNQSHECSICLEPVVSLDTGVALSITFPCKHVFHRVCVFAVLTTSTLGSDSMMRCPMCRYKLDRHDLGGGIFLYTDTEKCPPANYGS